MRENLFPLPPNERPDMDDVVVSSIGAAVDGKFSAIKCAVQYSGGHASTLCRRDRYVAAGIIERSYAELTREITIGHVVVLPGT